MNVRALFILFLPTFFLLSCREEENLFQRLEIGQTRGQIERTLGEPYEIKDFEKTGGPIWGPEEDFWDTIPDGTRLEVWRYRNDAGNLNLYFVGTENRLAYKAFAPKGIVYESAR